jgi:hypothetical protein
VTTFSAHNPVRGGITVLQRQDWFRGKLSGPYKRQSRAEARETEKNQRKNPEKKREQKETDRGDGKSEQKQRKIQS